MNNDVWQYDSKPNTYLWMHLQVPVVYGYNTCKYLKIKVGTKFFTPGKQRKHSVIVFILKVLSVYSVCIIHTNMGNRLIRIHVSKMDFAKRIMYKSMRSHSCCIVYF